MSLKLGNMRKVSNGSVSRIDPYPVVPRKDGEFSFHLMPYFVADIDFWPKAGGLTNVFNLVCKRI